MLALDTVQLPSAAGVPHFERGPFGHLAFPGITSPIRACVAPMEEDAEQLVQMPTRSCETGLLAGRLARTHT